MRNDNLSNTLSLPEQFSTAVEGYAYPYFFRCIAAIIVITLLGSLAFVLIQQNFQGATKTELTLIAVLMSFLGGQIVFGKTRIDASGLHRASLYRPHVKWHEISQAHFHSMLGTPRLSVRSTIGPMRFHAGSDNLVVAFKKISKYYQQ